MSRDVTSILGFIGQISALPLAVPGCNSRRDDSKLTKYDQLAKPTELAKLFLAKNTSTSSLFPIQLPFLGSCVTFRPSIDRLSKSDIALSINAMQTTKILSRASALSLQPTAMPISRSFASSSGVMQRVSELIKHDHAELRIYKNNILKGKDADEKVRWQNQFIWELARHSVAEELVVYPAMEKNIPGGKDLADRDRTEHQRVKDLLYRFQKLRPADNEFEPTLHTLWNDLESHLILHQCEHYACLKHGLLK
ncbi:hemerythrin HHE cation binding domain protein, partial [Aureobasidium pullulans]